MEQIRTLREQKKMSQAKLAVLADMNPATLWRYETGQRSPTVDQLERLAEVLGVEVSDFFPKDQAPLPLEGAGRTTVFEDAIAVAAGSWLEDMEQINGPNMSLDEIGKLEGYTKAALRLAQTVLPYKHGGSEEEADRAYKEFGQLPAEDQHAAIRLHELLVEVVNRGTALLQSDLETEKTTSG
jgi:transcriptional regulator with XRE-family HTH domain